MSDNSAIEWTDATWNPVRGCSRVSEGCRQCYAERMASRFSNERTFEGFAERTPDGPRWTGRVELMTGKLLEPLSWRRPRRVFVNSMSDLFHENLHDEAIDQVFAVMALASQHTFQVLTKRADRMYDYFARLGLRQELIGIEAERISGFDRYDSSGIGARWKLPLPNVWLLVSVEDQPNADARILRLLQTPAAVRGISYEPALGPINLRELGHFDDFYIDALDTPDPTRKLDWVIVGGESGPGARPFDIAWARSIVSQCQAAGVACFVKQLGAKPFEPYSDGTPFVELRLASKKGGDMAEWPADLRVREFPR